MPRIARTKSESGIYHVIVRGIDHLQLFFDDEDRQTFLDILARNKEKSHFKLYAFSLMSNHVHLLVAEQENGISLSELIQRVTTSYARRYNAKYGRIGYLFQGRFKSEAIESESYLLEVVRYIHNNPAKVGESIDSYTSFCDYVSTVTDGLTDTHIILNMFSKEIEKARKLFAVFLKAKPDEVVISSIIEESSPKKLTDTEAIALIKKFGEVRNCTDLGSLAKAQRDEALCRLRDAGLSVRRLSRLTGINRGIVLRAKGGS